MKEQERLDVEKNIITGAVVVTVVIVLLFFSYTIWYSDDNEEEPKTTAVVSFQLEDSQYFNVTCEVADEPGERNQGLMYREELPLDRGMLFVYETPKDLSFWMKNTLIPLDIIFIDENGVVLSVEEAEVEPSDTPDSELTRYRSITPAKWVVEINWGLSEQYGIGNGTQVSIQYLS